VGKAGEVTGPAPAWSAWRPLAGVPPLSSAVLAETLDGGQAFRWHRLADDTWLGVWSDNVARLRLDENQIVQWSAPAPLATKVARALPAYFGIERDFAALADSLPWRSDAHLARCIEAFRGLRILRQPFGETLLGFLCSATKQIVQIKQMLALLAERHGAPICRTPVLQTPLADAGRSGVSQNDVLQPIHRLPTWAELAEIPEADLRACLLGFRARYIHQTARFLAVHPGWLEETETLPYAAAKERLCTLPGVGEKVADCVLLFGAGKLEAFPVDVWILKTLVRRYGLEGWRPAPLAQFGRAHFGPLAGLAQQYLFAWERAQRPSQVSRNT
jgi:N-glycosylase/DNA lyase